MPIEILTHILNNLADPRHAVFVNKSFLDAWFDASTFWEKVYFFNVDESSIDAICATLSRVRCPIRSIYIEETPPSCILRILRAVPPTYSRVVLHDEPPCDVLMTAEESLSSLTAVISRRSAFPDVHKFRALRHLDLRFESATEVRVSSLPPLLEDLDLFGCMRMVWDVPSTDHLRNLRISREDDGAQIVPLECLPALRVLHVTASDVIVRGGSKTLVEAHFNGVHIQLDSASISTLFPALGSLTCHGDFFPTTLPESLAYLAIGVRSMDLGPDSAIDWRGQTSLRDIRVHGLRCHAMRCPMAVRSVTLSRSFVSHLYLPYLPFPVGVGWTASFSINHRTRRVKMCNSTITIDQAQLNGDMEIM